MKIEFTGQPSDCLAELGRHRMGEQVQGTHDAFRGDASAHIGFDNESRQAQRLLHGAQAFYNVPGRAKHHAFLQEFLIRQGRQLRGPRCALSAFELLEADQPAQDLIAERARRAGNHEPRFARRRLRPIGRLQHLNRA